MAGWRTEMLPKARLAPNPAGRYIQALNAAGGGRLSFC
jgi:hypothetical protein